MTASGDLLVARYPQYAGDSRVDSFLKEAAAQHDATAFGSVYVLAMIHFAAHLLLMADADAAAVRENGNEGPAAGGMSSGLTSRSSEGFSESYATPRLSDAAIFGLSAGESDLLRTSAGRAYLRLRQTRAATMPVVAR